MTKNILCIAEVRDGTLRKVSFELLTVARRIAGGLGGEVEAGVVGAGILEMAESLGAAGAARVYTGEEPSLAQFAPEAYAAALAEVIRRADPAVILFGATGHGKELSARTAAKLDMGLATDCTDAAVEGGELVLTRPIYAGKAIATIKPKRLPVMVSIRPNIFPSAEAEGGRATVIPMAIPKVPVRSRVVESVNEEKKGVDLAEAKIVVSGGRGVKGPEGFEPLRELCRTLGAALGSSRAAVDSGWIDYTHQVGQTGKTVAPQLYIAAGISGAIQHLAGMSSSKVIVAINKDPDAPIFKVADYGIVGDLFEVVPALNQAFSDLLARK